MCGRAKLAEEVSEQLTDGIDPFRATAVDNITRTSGAISAMMASSASRLRASRNSSIGEWLTEP